MKHRAILFVILTSLSFFFTGFEMAEAAARPPEQIPVAPVPEQEEIRVEVGDTESRVMEILGTPLGTSATKSSTIYMYKFGNIVIKNGKVATLPYGFRSAIKPKQDQLASDGSRNTPINVSVRFSDRIPPISNPQRKTGLNWVAEQREKEVAANLRARKEAERKSERKAKAIRRDNAEKRRLKNSRHRSYDFYHHY